MGKKRMILTILSLLLIVVPFFINIYSILKIISLALGIILLDVSFAMDKKVKVFFLFYLPLLLIIFTYGIDYLKTATLNLSPIYVFENKINDDISIFNSMFYRIYKCGNEYTFDNQYQKNFVCDTKLIDSIDINKLLNEPEISYKNYKNDFIKITGKVSKITGTSSIYLQAYTEVDGTSNGYVKFNETSGLKISLDGVDISSYRIYDYITIVGLVSDYNNSTQEITLINAKLEESNLYDNYDIQVIESSKCPNEVKEYVDGIYTYCIENVYLDYKVDKYELSYALKDKKITFENLLENSKILNKEGYIVYELEKFNVLSCSDNRKILINKNEKIDYSLCEE